MDKLFSHSLWDREYNGSQVVGLSGDSVLLVRAHVRLKRPDIDMAHKLGSAFLRGLEKHRDAEWLGPFTLDVSTVRFAETLAGGGSEQPWEHEEYLHWESNDKDIPELRHDRYDSNQWDPNKKNQMSWESQRHDQPWSEKEEQAGLSSLERPNESTHSVNERNHDQTRPNWVVSESPFINEQRVGWGEWSSWSECSPCSPQFDQIRTRR